MVSFFSSSKLYRSLLGLLLFVIALSLLFPHLQRLSNLSESLHRLKPTLKGRLRDEDTLPWIKKLGVRNEIVSSAEILRLNRDMSTPPAYQDPRYLKSCSLSGSVREKVFHLLKHWMAIAAEHNITWFLAAGTNLGSLRHADIIPWDHDADIGVFDADEKTIRKIAVQERKKMDRNKMNLVTRPGPFCPTNGPRMTCSGAKATHMVDVCSFCGPLARLIFKNSYFLDVYMLQLKYRQGKVVVRDQNFDSQSEKNFFPISMFFPLQFCKFIGLTVPCVHRSEEYAKLLYKDLRPQQICSGKGWTSNNIN